MKDYSRVKRLQKYTKKRMQADFERLLLKMTDEQVALLNPQIKTTVEEMLMGIEAAGTFITPRSAMLAFCLVDPSPLHIKLLVAALKLPK